MNANPRLSLALWAAAALAACSSVPSNNAMLDQARSGYQAAQALPKAQDYAGVELKQAADALARANEASARRDDTAQINHLAYLARQRAAIAQETVTQKTAESAVANADQARDQIRLDARTREADASQRQAELAQQQTSEANAQNARLEAQLKALNAKKTDRGMVITLGDVLFDTNRAQLRFGGLRAVERLAAFMQQYPQRKAVIEGFTDSVGSESRNQDLSERRATAVRDAMADRGIEFERMVTQGFGEEHPVADNGTSSGRQLNRRVEIVLSDDKGAIPAR